MNLDVLRDALERRGCKPVEVSPGRVLALCPCCGNLDLIIEHGGVTEPPTEAEKNVWLDHWKRAPR